MPPSSALMEYTTRERRRELFPTLDFITLKGKHRPRSETN